MTVLLLLALAGGIQAQNHTEDFLISGSSIQLLKGTGAFTKLYENPGTAHGIVNDIDNKLIVFAEGSNKGMFRLDPGTGLWTTILVDTTVFDYPTEITIDHHGDYIIASSDPSYTYGLYRLSGTTLTTIITTVTMGLQGKFTGGLVRDVDTGNFVLQMYGGSSGPHPMISIAPDGTFTTIIANYCTLGGPRYQITQDMRTGDFYVGGNDSAQGFLVQVTKGGTSTVVATSTDRFAFNVLAADRASSTAPRLVHPYIKNLYYTDLKTSTVTSVAVTGSSVSPRGITFSRGRNLQTVLTAPKKYALNFSFPTFPGKGYAAGLTLSGMRPGITLTDGRSIPANLDWLLVMTVNNGFQPIFVPGPGILDANGEAKGSMDLSTLPALGIPVHLVAVVLDSTASLGIAAIADPWVMVL